MTDRDNCVSGNNQEMPYRKNLDAAPAATADAERGCTDKADSRPGEGTGDTPAKRDTTPPRNGTAAWGSVQGGCTLTETERLGAANSGDDRRSVGGE